ncbi:MAG TPA: reverse transcriptase-like protein [bacterium]|nr:reverse transcriptase-like protein [bacterium]
MQRALLNLKNHLSSFLKENIDLSEEDLKVFAEKVWVILPAAGQGMRLREITGMDTNKNVLLINDDLTIIERTVLMYRGVGIKNFVVLVYHNADSVKDVLGDGSKFGVNIKYSFPDKPVGRGGAVLNALTKEILPKTAFAICHNPVDQIVDYPDFVRDVLRQFWHNYYNKQIPATIVVTTETPYQFTGMQIADSLVQEITMYPMIPVPAHIGVTCFSPDVYPYFSDLFNLEDSTADFESVLFPVLATERKLAAFGIDYHQWIPVKDNKQLLTLRQKLQADIVDEVKSDKGYYSLFVDGGSKGNPGPAAIGGVLYDELFNGVQTFKEYIGEATNNQAEYRALLKGLALAIEKGVKFLKLNMDSELVIKHLTGEYAVKDEQLKKYYDEAIVLLQKFEDVPKRHVKREFNKVADSLVNEAIKDAGIK